MDELRVRYPNDPFFEQEGEGTTIRYRNRA
jgi:hypothetical protein